MYLSYEEYQPAHLLSYVVLEPNAWNRSFPVEPVGILVPARTLVASRRLVDAVVGFAVGADVDD